MLPGDAAGRVVPGNVRSGALERGDGDVQAGDLPAVFGQPECICSFATTEIQGATRSQIGHFPHQLWVGIPAPGMGALPIDGFPEPFARIHLVVGVCHRSSPLPTGARCGDGASEGADAGPVLHDDDTGQQPRAVSHPGNFPIRVTANCPLSSDLSAATVSEQALWGCVPVKGHPLARHHRRAQRVEVMGRVKGCNCRKKASRRIVGRLARECSDSRR